MIPHAFIAASYILVRLTLGPGACASYAAEKSVAGSPWRATSLYATSTGGTKIPRIAESDSAWTDSAYVLVTQNADSLTSYRCRCVAGRAGLSSNALGIVAPGTFARDSLMYGWRGNLVTLATGGGANKASFPSPDSLAPFIETLDAEMVRRRAAHCNCFTYTWQHGVKVACP